MSRQDLENQQAGSSQQVEVRHDDVQAEVTQNHPNKSRLMIWFKLFRRHKQDQSADTRGRASSLGNGTCENENGSPNMTLDDIKDLFDKHFRLRRTKLEAKDGYTTHSFNSLARPIPVDDIFFSSRTLIVLRLLYHSYNFCLSGYIFLGIYNSGILWSLTFIALVCQRMDIHGVGRIPIPTLQQLWAINRYPQRFWETFASKLFFRLHAARTWWIVYLLISRMSDFEQNFLNAWSQRPIGVLPSNNSEHDSRTRTDEITERTHASLDSGEILDNERRQQNDHPNQDVANGTISMPRGLVLIFVNNESLNVPMLADNISDRALFEELRMFYRYSKVKRGLVELIIPKNLIRIDCVKLENTTKMAGEVTKTLDCGRRLQHFHYPETTTEARAISDMVQKLPDAIPPEGLEFVRTLDRSAIVGVIMAPPLASLVSIIVWLAVYLRKTEENHGDVDLQVVVTTAFTIASYLVTTGALITGLVAYLDSNTRDSEALRKEK